MEVSIAFFKNSFKNDRVLKKFSQKFSKSSYLGIQKTSPCRVDVGSVKDRNIKDAGLM